MPFLVPIDQARREYPEYQFIAELTPSEQKAAFHVRNQDGEDLCLKIIAPSFNMDRLQREIIALQAISHPNVVSLVEYTFSTSQGRQRHYLVEEFVAGNDLTAALHPGSPWSISRAQGFFAALCDGLAALRGAGVVHRDLKPSNIRVRADGSPVIIDFGLARHLGLSDLTRTAEGAAIGTPLYFAPEQFIGTKRDIDHRTDLFALGVLLYEAVVGHHPFQNSGLATFQELQDSVCASTEYLTDLTFLALPPQWQLLMARLLEKERGRRPREADQVAEVMRKLGATT
jgi:serine/threonine protein kinase